MIRGLRFTKFKGGEGSGHHGHVGRPGSVGGSAPGSVNFTIAPIKLVEHYGYEVPTEDDIRQVNDVVSELPKEVLALYDPEGQKIYLAITPDPQGGQHRGGWAIVPRGGTEVTKHEVLHAIVNQHQDKLGAYKPTKLFNHAARNPNQIGQKNEDLTMALNGFSKNKETWAKTISSSLWGEGLSYSDASTKIAEVTRFMQYLGRWP